MAENTFDVVGIGNAIVDVIARHDDAFIDRFGLTKGSMELIDAERAVELYDAIEALTETSGGSAGNTLTGVASFGGRACFIGKVADDHLGTVFAADSRAQGVEFSVAPSVDGDPTGRSMIVVTPDAERTMNTFLGAATTLYRDDIPHESVANGSILYCEGYIWDIDVTKDAIRHAIEISRAGGNRISFTLSDSFCVHRHFEEWHQLLDGQIDILFGNEEELMALAGTETHAEAVDALRGRCEILVATMGPAGSIIATADSVIEVPAVAVEEVVDTTGAGDQFAAGFLFGITQDMSLFDSAMLGSKAAAEVISHLGPRPQISLSSLLD